MAGTRSLEYVSINHRTRALAGILKTIAFLMCAAVLAALAPGISAPAAASARRATRVESPFRLAQFGSPEDQPDVAPEDVQKYVKVYKAMQADHKLTVQQAAAQQGLTVQKFRTLEDQIERNDALRMRVRKELRAAANPSPTRGK
jgi:hypothetical protein